jgi:hypothetical protein
VSLFKRSSEKRVARTAKLGASAALIMGVLAGFGGALIASTTPASAGTANGVAYSCAAPAPVGTVTGITANVSETPNLPATDQWGTTYTETPSVTLNVPGGLIGLGASFGQTSLSVSDVDIQLDTSGFTSDPSQTADSTNSVTVPINATTEADGASATFTYAPLSFTTTTGTAQTDTITLDPALSLLVLGAVSIDCTATTSPVLDSVTVHAPIPEPPVVVTPQTATVSNGQCVNIPVLTGATAQNNTLDDSSVTVTTAPTYGTATAGTGAGGNGIPVGEIGYCTNSTTNPGAANGDSFQWTVAGTLPTPPATTPAPSSPGTVNISINFLTCVAGSGNGTNGGSTGGTLGNCSLNQLVLLPVTSGQIVLSQASSLPVDGLGSSICTGGQVPGITLNGQEQTACGVMSPMTVTNATGLDTGWTLTGQTTDFVDPAVATNATLNNCDTIATYNNHCIPGDNLAWSPAAAVSQNIVPGDTAEVTPGAAVPLPAVQAPTLPTNPELAGVLQNPVQSNPVTEEAPTAGLHHAPQTLCSTTSGEAGGTFICGAGLALAVPASIANPTGNGYEATLTLTLTL